MNQIKKISVFILISANFAFAQIDDLLNTEIPIQGVWQPGSGITTGFNDAYPAVNWMNNFDILVPEKLKNNNISEGYYYSWVESYCLKAGKKGPVTGSGYLLAPLKGDMAEIIKNILRKRNQHPEITREDVQILLWSIEAGTNFTELDPGLQSRVSPLLTAEEILRLNFKTGDILNLLPDELKEAANYYRGLRQMLLDPGKSFREIEQYAVPVDLKSLLPVDTVYNGAWNYIGNGYYARSFSNDYSLSYYEFYKPLQTSISRDIKNRITSIKSGNYTVEISYMDNPELIEGKYSAEKFSVVKLVSAEGNTYTVSSSGWVIAPDFKSSGTVITSSVFTNQLSAEEYLRRAKISEDKLKDLKDYVGKLKTKKKLKLNEGELLSIYRMTEALRVMLNTDRSLNIDVYNKAYDLLNNAEYYINAKNCGQTENISGQSRSNLFDRFSGLAMVPADTDRQRLCTGGYEADPGPVVSGNPNGGPGRPRTTGDPYGSEGNNNTNNEKDTNECSPHVIIKQTDRNYLPAAGSEVIVELDIQNTANCRIEGVRFILRSVTSYPGVCINDKRICYNTSLDVFFKQSGNPELIISADSLKAEGGDVRRAVISINDYAAFGMMEAQVKINDTWYTASEEYTGNTMISIPVDRDGDAIADSWEREFGVEGKPLTWDEDEPLHRNRGDGLTLFEEYRGMFEKLPDGRLEYLRTNPVRKEICVIDNSELLSISLFERLSGIKVVKLDERTVYGSLAGADDTAKYRHVNFSNTSYSGVKYAINIKNHSGLNDPDPRNPTRESTWGYCDFGPPVYSYNCYIMPDRVRLAMQKLTNIIDSALTNSTGDTVLIRFANSGGTRIFLRVYLENILNTMRNPNKYYLIIDFIVNYLTVHEIMHGCNVTHHGNDAAGMEDTGNQLCVMYYQKRLNYATFSMYLLSRIPDEWFAGNEAAVITANNLNQLCGMPGLTVSFTDNCYMQININDRLGR